MSDPDSGDPAADDADDEGTYDRYVDRVLDLLSLF